MANHVATCALAFLRNLLGRLFVLCSFVRLVCGYVIRIRKDGSNDGRGSGFDDWVLYLALGLSFAEEQVQGVHYQLYRNTCSAVQQHSHSSSPLAP